MSLNCAALKVFFTLMCSVLLQGCGTAVIDNQPTNEKLPSGISLFSEWSADAFHKYLNEKQMGSIRISIDKNLDPDTQIRIFEKKNGEYKAYYYIGRVPVNITYDVILFPGQYEVSSFLSGSIIRKQVNNTVTINVEGGQTTAALVVPNEIQTNTFIANLNNEVKFGSFYSAKFAANKMRARLVIERPALHERNLTLFVRTYNAFGLPIFKLNDEIIQSNTSRNIVDNGVEYRISLNLSEGLNKFKAIVAGVDKVQQSASYEQYLKNSKELEIERLENAKKEQERLAKIELERQSRLAKIEAERLAKIAEKERIAREGDGSPDDLQCKQYGLKPQTQGYAECRMRLDLARKEQQREEQRQQDFMEQQRIMQQQQLESADKARQSRESQCRFVQSAEYAKPTLGGFFESMQRANSAFDNCMNGVPTINTTCSRDAFGNLNCTSR